MEAMGSVLTNKYAEGYPGARYYGGCEVVDRVETLAIERVCVSTERIRQCAAPIRAHKPHGGLLRRSQTGDTFMGLDLAHGGHLSHGWRSTCRACIQRRRVPTQRADRHDRLRRHGTQGAGTPSEAHHRRRLGLFARMGLQTYARNRRTRWARCCSSTWPTRPD